MRQLDMFDFIEDEKEIQAKKLADRVISVLNDLDTKFKDTFFLDRVEIHPWHTGRNTRTLSIYIESTIADYREYTLLPYNGNNKEEAEAINDALYDNFGHLTKDKDFSITMTPMRISIYWHNIDFKDLGELEDSNDL